LQTAPNPTSPDLSPRAEHARNWTRILNRYREPNAKRSVIELLVTMLPLVLLWALMWFVLQFSFWLCLLIAVPAAGFLVRLFMIQHDCGHGAFFSHKLANDWVGRVLGVLTLTPYDFWRRTHALHHASSGNLDNRGIGDIDTLTVREYLARSRWGQLKYRLYRHPAVMFGLGPAYLFVMQHRLPVGMMRGAGWGPWLSTMATNAGIVLLAALLIWFVGLKAFLLVHVPIVLISASIGVWLFYVQHQFEETNWDRPPDWNPLCMVLHTTTCRACCAGSPPISASTTCTICPVKSPTTGCHACCAITRSWPRSGD
jgi:omega-6 fatty acid desaturase (delta-12 desaturase)